MAKLTSVYVCQQCGYRSPQYLGRCPECDSWNTFEEEIEKGTPLRPRFAKASRGEQGYAGQAGEIINLADVNNKEYDRLSSTIDEFDRVLGGGIVRGSITLVAGDPGIGKSTLLTQLAISVPKSLYIAGEESAQQIKLRTDRINVKANLSILNETNVDAIIASVEQNSPALVIIDSIQTLETQDLTGVAGSVGQVRECAHRLQKLAKASHIPIILVGHVTKEGTVAGPKTLEHMVDVVLSLEGDPTTNFRILRGNKNRFGATDEVGIFEMEDSGMKEVKNPSKLFLERRQNAPGSAVVPVVTGLRPILVEIQALVTKSSLPQPRRTSSGVDNNRLQLLVAVLQKRLGLSLFDQDIFVNVTGGLRVFEPAADLGICIAIISSFKDKVVSSKTAFIGEVGLLGEIREVRGLEKRTSEAKKLGFINVISTKHAKSLFQAQKLVIDSD